MSIFDTNTEINDEPVQVQVERQYVNFYNEIKNGKGEPLKLWKPKKGPNYIDIIPFQMATDKFANVSKSRAKGCLVPDIMVDVQWNKQQGNTYYNQVSRSGLGLPDDPFQEEAFRQFALAKKEGVSKASDKEVKSANAHWKTACSLFPKTRSLYLIAVYDDTKTKREFFLYSPAYHSFGKLLKEKKEAKEAIGEKIDWRHLPTSPTICIIGVEKEFENSKFIGFDSIELMPRIKPYGKTVEDVEQLVLRMPSLDEYINIPTYEEAYKVCFGVDAPGPDAEPEESEPTLVMDTPTTVAEEETTSFEEPVEEEAAEDDFDDIPF